MKGLTRCWFFLGIAKFPLPARLMFNACTPSIILYLIGYFTSSMSVMAAFLPFLLFFGGGGLFVFSWSGTSLITQVGHILMTLASSYILIHSILVKKWKYFLLGFIIGILAFLIFLPYQQRYVRNHPEY